MTAITPVHIALENWHKPDPLCFSGRMQVILFVELVQIKIHRYCCLDAMLVEANFRP